MMFCPSNCVGSWTELSETMRELLNFHPSDVYVRNFVTVIRKITNFVPCVLKVELPLTFYGVGYIFPNLSKILISGASFI
jgi:hypothetical protein